LSCCGAPARWAGREEEQRKLNDQLRESWEQMGRPVMITACLTCEKVLRESLPEIKTISLYSIIAEYGMPAEAKPAEGRIITVFDPCASWNSPQTQADVRKILIGMGYVLSELPYIGEEVRCCSYGGQIHAVNRPLMEEIAKNRVKASPNDYVTYCINCREIFAHESKPVIHVLDLILGRDEAERLIRKPASLSESRKNREELRRRIVEQYGETGIESKKEEQSALKLYIAPELLEKMDRELILTEDAERVIRHCEDTGIKLLDCDTGNMVGHLQMEVVTYWVVYRPEGDGFRLLNIQCQQLKESYDVD